jgi:hypothetical protein
MPKFPKSAPEPQRATLADPRERFPETAIPCPAASPSRQLPQPSNPPPTTARTPTPAMAAFRGALQSSPVLTAASAALSPSATPKKAPTFCSLIWKEEKRRCG